MDVINSIDRPVELFNEFKENFQCLADNITGYFSIVSHNVITIYFKDGRSVEYNGLTHCIRNWKHNE